MSVQNRCLSQTNVCPKHFCSIQIYIEENVCPKHSCSVQLHIEENVCPKHFCSMQIHIEENVCPKQIHNPEGEHGAQNASSYKLMGFVNPVKLMLTESLYYICNYKLGTCNLSYQIWLN